MNAPALYIIDLGLILSLYAAKALVFRYLRPGAVMLAAYCAAIALAVAVTWLCSPDWHNELVRRIAVWVGTPVAVLSVPLASFLFDFISGRRNMRLWHVRIPLEIFLLVPLWFVLWLYIIVSLGWLSEGPA